MIESLIYNIPYIANATLHTTVINYCLENCLFRQIQIVRWIFSGAISEKRVADLTVKPQQFHFLIRQEILFKRENHS